VQVEFEKANLETRFSLDEAQGLKPGAFKLWVNLIQLAQPHRALALLHLEGLDIAVQVEFEK
jgi:hypothetical protein